MTRSRWEEYKELFRQADLPDGVRCGQYGPETVVVSIGIRSTGGGYEERGFLYTVDPLVASDQTTLRKLPLDNGWYLYTLVTQ